MASISFACDIDAYMFMDLNAFEIEGNQMTIWNIFEFPNHNVTIYNWGQEDWVLIDLLPNPINFTLHTIFHYGPMVQGSLCDVAENIHQDYSRMMSAPWHSGKEKKSFQVFNWESFSQWEKDLEQFLSWF